MLFVLVAIAGKTGSVRAQDVSAASNSRSVTVTARIEGRLAEILDIRATGAPVQLSDGTSEQRYTVVANVAFTMASPSGDRDEIRVTESGTESRLADFVGTPGFHAEIRVRLRAPTHPAITISRHRGPTPHSGSSGSGN
jgi:hypothetical protein